MVAGRWGKFPRIYAAYDQLVVARRVSFDQPAQSILTKRYATSR
jgi:hypothetical protein